MNRNKYRVTITRADGRRDQHTVYADSPEHAVKKVRKREGRPDDAGTSACDNSLLASSHPYDYINGDRNEEER